MTANSKADPKLSRRALLFKTGLIAGGAYLAPVMLGLSAARASDGSNGNSGGQSNGNSAPSRGNGGKGNKGKASRGKKSAPSRGKNSRPSRNRNSGPSRGSRR